MATGLSIKTLRSLKIPAPEQVVALPENSTSRWGTLSLCACHRIPDDNVDYE
jgi:hypothetical protein